MWYENTWRRHLCDMHIDEWDEAFLSKFSPEEYVENLKRAKVQNAMLYFQSHVGLCYYPTKCGKMHRAFTGREDMMKRVEELCHEAGITVTGYYSLIYNNWAHDKYPKWRIVGPDGRSARENGIGNSLEFSAGRVSRYGTCCPNNMQYRAFVKEQIREMAAYFNFEGFFFDMLFWPEPCQCESCRQRWEKEVGGPMPDFWDVSSPGWLQYVEKRREWMGEFAQWAATELKKVAPHASVEQNLAGMVNYEAHRCSDERVNDACDYAGGDMYEGLYSQSFSCKLYRKLSKHQPFEYMFSRCEPNLGMHTTIKSEDFMTSSLFLTAAHHGATLVIDAINPIGTLDKRVYEQVGTVFEKQIPYEPYLTDGEMIEDIGVYYSLKNKQTDYQAFCNHEGALATAETLVRNHVNYGVTGGYADISRYQTLILSCPNQCDKADFERICENVKNGGKLYFSGVESPELLQTFFGEECYCEGYTKERITYITPNRKCPEAFEWFNEDYPLQFASKAPKIKGMKEQCVLATVTLPYTGQDGPKFASIHSNPPGIRTEYPSVARTSYGKGTVLWSACPVECCKTREYRRMFFRLLKYGLQQEQTIWTDAPQDVEILGFRTNKGFQINAVLLNEEDVARHVETFFVSVKCEKCPKQVVLMPKKENIAFKYENETVKFQVSHLPIFAMYEIWC